jgi:hypothetical protein
MFLVFEGDAEGSHSSNLDTFSAVFDGAFLSIGIHADDFGITGGVFDTGSDNGEL